MNLSRWSKVLGILPLVGALAGMSGCNRNADSETPATAAGELAAEPGKGGKAHMGGKHRGPAMLLGAALRELEMTDTQRKTIEAEMEALREDMEDRADDLAEGREAHRKALAAAVRSGKVDEAALLAEMKKDAPAPDTARLAKAVQVLYETLTPAQRSELVAAVNEKMEKHAKGGPDHKGGGHKGKRGDKDAHHDKGERGPKGERGHDGGRGRDGGRGHGMRGHGMGGPLGHVLHGIELSDDQRAKVREAFEKMGPSAADRDAVKGRHEAFRTAMKERLASFASDKFDAKAFVAMPKDAAMGGPEGKGGHMVKALAVVVPILDAAQREELAKRIEEGPAHK